MFGRYDATEDRGRRKSPTRVTKREEDVATEQKRRILSGTAADLERNFCIAAWAIRRHLDYVTPFTFQAKTADKGFNDAYETALNSQMTRFRFDQSQRHPHRRALRLAEAMAVKDGDVLWIKLAPPTGSARGRVQTIEGDLVRTPNVGVTLPATFNRDEWTNGVRLNASGAAQSYAVTKRTHNSQVELRRIVPANNAIHHAFYARYDQVRGVSPIASALNWFADTYEAFEFAIAKVKIAQMFGIMFYREGEQNPFGSKLLEATEDTDGDGINDASYELPLTSPAPFAFDGEPGDRAEILESKTPATETTDFLKLMIHVALSALDIPFSFFDASFTNFYGSRGSLIQYLKSCDNKIRNLQDFQNEWTRWRTGLLLVDGDLTLPSGKDFDWLKWEWVPDGVPWWDPVKEVRGAAMGVAAGFTSPQRVCKETGTDFETNIREIAEAQRIAQEAGVTITYADSTAFRPEISTTESEQADGQNAS